VSRDVSLKSYVDAGNRWMLLLGLSVVVGMGTVIAVIDVKNAKATTLALGGAEEAIKVAVKSVEEKGVHHNGLIDRMREMSAQYVTRGNVYAALVAAGICSAIWGVFGQ
jgi:hypothetical protein